MDVSGQLTPNLGQNIDWGAILGNVFPFPAIEVSPGNFGDGASCVFSVSALLQGEFLLGHPEDFKCEEILDCGGSRLAARSIATTSIGPCAHTDDPWDGTMTFGSGLVTMFESQMGVPPIHAVRGVHMATFDWTNAGSPSFPMHITGNMRGLSHMGFRQSKEACDSPLLMYGQMQGLVRSYMRPQFRGSHFIGNYRLVLDTDVLPSDGTAPDRVPYHGEIEGAIFVTCHHQTPA